MDITPVKKEKVAAVLADKSLIDRLPAKEFPDSTFKSNARAVLKLTQLETNVLEAFRMADQDGGLTDLELELIMDDPAHNASYRWAKIKLHQRGLVHDTGNKRCLRGIKRKVWRISRP